MLAVRYVVYNHKEKTYLGLNQINNKWLWTEDISKKHLFKSNELESFIEATVNLLDDQNEDNEGEWEYSDYPFFSGDCEVREFLYLKKDSES